MKPYKPSNKTLTQALTWATGNDVGASSKTMVRYLILADAASSKAHPLDPSDLGRCIRAIEAIPAMRRRLRFMAEVSPSWGALVGRWTKLTNLYKSEAPSGRCPKTYNLMKDLIGLN